MTIRHYRLSGNLSITQSANGGGVHAMICSQCGTENGVAANFCSQCGSQLASGQGAAEMALRGERRQLTALFCDLVNSTELANTLDPEEYHDTIRDFAACCGAAVASFEGHVAEMRGDGALVFFGYPKSHGDEPERAVRAALRIVEAVGEAGKRRGQPLRRSEEHTSELQSQFHLVCRLLLEKKKKKSTTPFFSKKKNTTYNYTQ